MQVNKFWLGHLETKKKVHIYGAGITGLLAGYYLKKMGVDFTLYEKSSRVGGKLHTEITDNGIVEWAANAIVDSPEVQRVLTDLGLSPINASPGLKKCIYRNAKIRTFPAITFKEGLNIFKNLFKTIPLGHETNSLKTSFQPLLGEKICDELLSPIFRGVYATGSDNLHTDSVLLGFKEFEGFPYHNFITNKLKNKSPIQSLSFQMGMQELVDALENNIKNHIQLNSNEGLRENALICTDPKSAVDLVENSFPDIAKILNTIGSVPIHSCTYFLDNEIHELKKCFGLLFNEKDSPNIMGVLVNHEIFPQRDYRKYCYTVISQTRVENFSSIPILGKYNKDLNSEFHASQNYGLPLFNPTRVNAIKQLSQNKKCGFWGNYVGQISLRSFFC